MLLLLSQSEASSLKTRQPIGVGACPAGGAGPVPVSTGLVGEAASCLTELHAEWCAIRRCEECSKRYTKKQELIVSIVKVDAIDSR
jgi:hypothetical protein